LSCDGVFDDGGGQQQWRWRWRRFLGKLPGAAPLGAGQAHHQQQGHGRRVRRQASQDRPRRPPAGGALAQGRAGAHAGVRALLRDTTVQWLGRLRHMGRDHCRRRHGIHSWYGRVCGV